jgi:hypothetical protein
VVVSHVNLQKNEYFALSTAGVGYLQSVEKRNTTVPVLATGNWYGLYGAGIIIFLLVLGTWATTPTFFYRYLDVEM